MSLSQKDGMKTAILRTSGISNATEELQLDAREDRDIHAVRIQLNKPLDADINGGARVHTGNDPQPAQSSTTQDEQLYVRADADQVDDDTNGIGYATTQSDPQYFDPVIPWDRHVTLTVTGFENSGDGSLEVEVTVYYTER